MNLIHISAINESVELGQSLNLRYRHVGVPWVDNSRLKCHGPGSPLYHEAMKVVSGNHVWPKKFLLANKVVLSGPKFSIYSIPEKKYVIGSPINWHKPTLVNEISRPGGQDITVNEVEYIERGFVLTAPGFRVYGHWLLDFFIRLLLIKEYRLEYGEDIPVLSRKIPPWAWPFVYAAGLCSAIKEYDNHENILLDEAIIPLAPKDGALYSQFALKNTFDHLKDYLFSFQAGEYHERKISHGADCFSKILVLRDNEPCVVNQEELASRLFKKGFFLLYPQKFSLADQARIFSDATVVVGEDGSALHNIGFCEPSTKAVMWGREERVNLRHLSVARAAGVDFSIISTSISDNGYSVDVDSIVDFLQHL